ncbi:thioesterase family protein [Dongia soli]|uniref:Thioesterase family protein n=1 Tax=Dongia soli TaxID=600628 RepID=A0ABU5E9P3_9PROT|nr:thioesterase family protein [Dongia soli]MDY0882576.1 thioesterase family protein [Dongia soli]
MVAAAPLSLHRAVVKPEWVDYNGHLNDAYYMVIFSQATDAFMDYIGLDDAARRATRTSLYTLEGHINYLLEVKEGVEVEIRTRLIRHDAKRMQLYHEMFRPDHADPVAAAEFMLLHVDTTEGAKSAPFRPEIAAKLQEIQAAQDALPPSTYSSRTIELKPKA